MKALMISLFALVGCGQIEELMKPEDKPEIMVKGYIQRAFEIKVDGVTFLDSENFYTNFLSQVVAVKYPNESANNNITLEGSYGLEDFGSDAMVFAYGSDKEVIQTKTDGDASFSFEGKESVSYSVKVVMRIGLLLEDKETKEEVRYCYLLKAQEKANAGQNVIFDEFSTQLNSSQCSDEATFTMPAEEQNFTTEIVDTLEFDVKPIAVNETADGFELVNSLGHQIETPNQGSWFSEVISEDGDVLAEVRSVGKVSEFEGSTIILDKTSVSCSAQACVGLDISIDALGVDDAWLTNNGLVTRVGQVFSFMGKSAEMKGEFLPVYNSNGLKLAQVKEGKVVILKVILK